MGYSGRRVGSPTIASSTDFNQFSSLSAELNATDTDQEGAR
jgi:hypothetical protein